MSGMRCRTRAAAFLLAVLCVAHAGDCTGADAWLRMDAGLSGRAALRRCALVRPALGLRRVSSCQKGHGWAQMRGGRGAEARLRGRMLRRSRSQAGRAEALAPRRGSQLRGLREQSGADAATAADPWVWECVRCETCPVRVTEAVTPPAHAEPAHPLCASCKGCTHSLEMLNLTARACLACSCASAPLDSLARPRIGDSAWRVERWRDHNAARQHGRVGAGGVWCVTRCWRRAWLGPMGLVPTLADASGKHAGVVKLHGVQSAMVEPSKLVQMRRRYKPGQHYARNEHALARAAAGIASDCGLSRVALREWVAPLRAVVPGSKEVVVLREALWAERADGVSVEALALALPRQQLLSVLAAVPHQAVRDAVLFDALTMQGDRHGENVFLSRSGRYIKLIDNRDAMLDANGLDSLFVPSTATFQRSRVGWIAFGNGGPEARRSQRCFARMAHAPSLRRALPSCHSRCWITAAMSREAPSASITRQRYA